MARQYKTGIIVTGDSKGGVKAVTLTDDSLQKLNRTSKRTQGATKSLSASFGGLRSAIAPVAAAIGGLSFAALIRDTVNQADQLSKLSTRLGISVEALSQLEFAAERGGLSLDVMTTALQRQARRISEAAKGTGEAVKAFQELGLSAEKLNQLSPDEQFEVLAEALDGVANHSDRVRLAMKFWDSEGVRLLQVADGGADAVRRLRDESDALGRTVSGETAKAAAELNDQMTNLGGALQGAWMQIAQHFVPWLAEWAKALNEQTIPATLNWMEALFGIRTEINQLPMNKLQARIRDTNDEMQSIRVTIIKLEKQFKELQGRGSGAMGVADVMERTQKAIKRLTKEKDTLTKESKELLKRYRELTDVIPVAKVELENYTGATGQASGKTGDLADNAKKAEMELQKLLDTLLPAEKATREFEGAIARLDEAFFSGSISAERYDAAIEALTTGTEKAAKAAMKPVKVEFDRTTEYMAQSLTDALMRGFEDGKGFLKNFLDTMRNWFGTLVLRPLIESAVSVVGGIAMSAIGSAFGGGAGAAGGGAGSMMTSTASSMGMSALGSSLGSGFTGMMSNFGATGIGGMGLGASAGIGGIGGYFVGKTFGDGSDAAAMGGAIGGGIGAMFGPIGFVVGSALGTLVGSMLGSTGDKSPDLQVTPTTDDFGTPEIRETSSGGTNIQRFITESLFGNLQWRTKHDAFGSVEDAQQFASGLQGAADIENALASLTSEANVEIIAARIDEALGQSMIKLAEEPGDFESGLEAFLAKRFEIAFDVIGGGMERVFQSIEAGAAEAAGITVDLFMGLERLASVEEVYRDFVEESSMTLYDIYARQRDITKELIESYTGGAEATVALTEAINQQGVATFELMGEIDEVIESIQATLGSTRRNLELQLLGTDEARYEFLRTEAETLAASIGTMTDPAMILDTVNQINALTQQGLGLLSEDQIMGGMGQDFIGFLSQLEENANIQLEATREDARRNAESLAAQVDAATLQIQAAEQQAAATQTFSQAVSSFAALGAGALLPDSGDQVALRPV